MLTVPPGFNLVKLIPIKDASLNEIDVIWLPEPIKKEIVFRILLLYADKRFP
jgi:hypothetical protein